MTERLSRRWFFRTAAAAGAAATLPAAAQVPGPPLDPAIRPPPRFFFTGPEAGFVTAAVDRLIPADDWPSASEAGVVEYIDRQLAGAYGAGARLYRQGPWRTGTPRQGYQLPFTPAQLYRTAIEGIERALGGELAARPEDEQDAILRALESGDFRLDAPPAAVFFETLLANTIEGWFADPAHGGNRDMAGWRMVGFPGAYAQFAPFVEHHGMRFDRPPMGFATAPDHHHHHHE